MHLLPKVKKIPSHKSGLHICPNFHRLSTASEEPCPLSMGFGSCLWVTHIYYKKTNFVLTHGLNVRGTPKTLKVCNPKTRSMRDWSLIILVCGSHMSRTPLHATEASSFTMIGISPVDGHTAAVLYAQDSSDWCAFALASIHLLSHESGTARAQEESIEVKVSSSSHHPLTEKVHAAAAKKTWEDDIARNTVAGLSFARICTYICDSHYCA